MAKHDFQVGWVTFIQNEVEALHEASVGWQKIYALQPAAYRANNEHRHLAVANILEDAAKYIVANIGRPNSTNVYLPSTHVSVFTTNEVTVGRLNAAALSFNRTYDTLPIDVRRKADIMQYHADVWEALTALLTHVNWVIEYNDKKRY